jgi:uncharacterized protein
MATVNLRSFRIQVRRRKTALRRFLTRLEKKSPRGLDRLTAKIEQEIWSETDCLHCANCCKVMSPTYTAKDVRRAATFLGMTAADFREKWLEREKSTGDWINKSTPCQFLDLKTNMCSIYEVRPADCAGFPHISKKRMIDYMHVHKQNLEYCPATLSMVEKMQKLLP